MNENCKDYRCTKYDENFFELELRKKKLELHIKNKSKYQNMRNAVTQKEEFKDSFIKIYNERCSYCGVNLCIISTSDFEVDHFLCESYCIEKKIYPHGMENLVLSCKSCNRLKSSFKLNTKKASLVNPDNGIYQTFCRSDNYKIIIVDEYKDTEVVQNFYNELRLSSETRRLDYLIMNIDGLSKICKNEQVKDKLKAIAYDLSKIRRKKFSTLSNIKAACS